MIHVRRHTESGEMEIGADPEGLAALAAAVANAPTLIAVETPKKIWPYDEALASVRVEPTDSLVLIDHDEGAAAMRITGSQESRKVLAENLVSFAREGKPGEHWHVEWFPDHFYLAEGGAPVVVAFSKIQYPEMRAQVITSLRSLSDLEHQRTQWGKVTDDEGHYDDLDLNVHVLYDDTTVLPDPVESVGSIITADEVDVLEKLNSVLEPIIDELGDEPDAAYLAHPGWNAVVSAAADAVQVLERND